MKGALCQMPQNSFSEKWKTFSPLGNVSTWKRRKADLAICKAKLFFTVIFQICGC